MGMEASDFVPAVVGGRGERAVAHGSGGLYGSAIAVARASAPGVGSALVHGGIS